MISSNTYPDMTYLHHYQHQTPLYEQQPFSNNNSMIALPQPIINKQQPPLRLFNSNNQNSINQLLSNNSQYNSSMLTNKPYCQLRSAAITSFNSNNNTIISSQQQYQHQPWKLGRTSNELMLSHEVVVPSSTLPSPPTQQFSAYESTGLPMDSSYYNQQQHQYASINNNSYYCYSPPSPPSLSVSSSTTSTSVYSGSNSLGSTANNNHRILSSKITNPYQYRRSSINTSRSSSPSTTSSYHESSSRISRPAMNKRYSCQLCSKRFTRPSSLTTHIYSHTGEKPFRCPVSGCHRHFSVVSNLRRHAKIHSNRPIPKGSASPSSTVHSFNSC